jgi:hypothetical protein
MEWQPETEMGGIPAALSVKGFVSGYRLRRTWI